MSWNASAHVLKLAEKYPELTLTQMAVLYALAARHNHEYHCAFGTLKRIAGDAHVHPVTVSTTVTELEDKGLLRVYEGQIPRKKSDPEDRRFTRGTLWCFIGLDPDDGPDIEGVTPRVRTSGRPSAESISPRLNQFGESISPGLTDELAESEDELAGDCGSISREGVDELAGEVEAISPGLIPASRNPSRARAPVAGFKPDTTRSVVEPEKEPASARAPDEAAPRRAADDEPDGAGPPLPKWEGVAPGQWLGHPNGNGQVDVLRPDLEWCPGCRRAVPAVDFEVHFAEHDIPHAPPGAIGAYLSGRSLRPRAATVAVQPDENPSPDPEWIKREHERRLAARRTVQPASQSNPVPAGHSPAGATP